MADRFDCISANKEKSTLWSFLQNGLSEVDFPAPGGAKPAASGQAGAVL